MHYVSYAHVYLSHGVIDATRTHYDSFNRKHLLFSLNFVKKLEYFYTYTFLILLSKIEYFPEDFKNLPYIYLQYIVNFYSNYNCLGLKFCGKHYFYEECGRNFWFFIYFSDWLKKILICFILLSLFF